MPEYLSERYRQLFIIALGELILVTGVDYANKHDGTIGGHSLTVVVLFANTVLLWRIYTYRAAELPAAMAAAANPGRVVRWAMIAHLPIMVGIIASSVGYGLVIQHPQGHTEPVWVAVILGGPALFIVGQSGFRRTFASRVARDRIIGLLVLLALAPAMPFLTPLAAATTATAVLAGIAIADAANSRIPPTDIASAKARGPS